MLNFPSPEKILLLAIIALVVLGPTRLPGAAHTAGKWISELRKLTSRFKEEIDGTFGDETSAITSAVGELRNEVGGWRNEMMDLTRTVTGSVAPVVAAMPTKPATWAEASNGKLTDTYPSVPPAESVSNGSAPLPPTPDDPSLN